MGKWPHLAHPRYPGDHQLEDKLILHRHLREEEVDPVVPALSAVWALSNHIGMHKGGLCREDTQLCPHMLRGLGIPCTQRALGKYLNVWRYPCMRVLAPPHTH